MIRLQRTSLILVSKNMYKKLLYLPIEIIPRELDSKLLITHKALDKGYSIILGTKSGVYSCARSYGKGIYFYKDHSPLSSNLLQELRVAGLKIVNMDEEGLSWPSPEVYSSLRIDKRTIQISDAIFVWGQKQYDVLTAATPGYENKIHIVGNPRFDILHSKYRQFLRDQSKYNLSSIDKGYVLINSMFTPGNWNPLIYGTPSYVEHLRVRGFIKNDEDFKFYSKVSENSVQLFKAYVSLIKKLSKLFPSTKFVIRPHPDENHEAWRNHFSSVDNVIVEYSGNATYWILGAKVLIYSGCTTAIEAWAMNKPTLRYHPNPKTKFDPELPNQFGKNIKTEAKLVEELRVLLSSSEDKRFDVDSTFAESFIKNVFTADSAENIVRVLDNLSFTHDYWAEKSMFSINHLKKKIHLLFQFDIKKRWGTRLIEKIKRIMNKSDDNKEFNITKARKQKFPGLKQIDIEDRLISLDKISGKKSEQKRDIVKLAPNTYKIENNFN